MEAQSTGNFTVSGTTVTGSGSTPAGRSDYFYAQGNVTYNVVIASGANLFYSFDNSRNANNAGVERYSSADSEVVYLTSGNFTNNGTINTYPKYLNLASNRYHATSTVIFINNTAATPSQVVNNGMIGDATISQSTFAYGYYQEDTTGILINNGTIINNAGATISGFNGVFTKGKGVINNYGTIYAVNDAVLSAYVVNNYANASMSTGDMGFANIHAYNTVNNYGYMLGRDYGILASGKNYTINDYGGAAVPGVYNYDGSQVYNGEISALARGSILPNTTGPFNSNVALMLDSSNVTVNLISTTVNNVTYLPVIVGPMNGGFNGGFASSTENVRNTLNFNFNGITTEQAKALQDAISSSFKSGPNGTYYTGSVTLNGTNTYQWVNFASVQFNGTVVQGGKPTPVASSSTLKASAKHQSVNIAVGHAVQTQASGVIAKQQSTSFHAASGTNTLDVGLMVTGLLVLIVLASVAYRWCRKRMWDARRKRIAMVATVDMSMQSLEHEDQKKSLPKTFRSL